MDPLTHAAAGAAIAAIAVEPRHARTMLIAGAAAALAPDLDVLIRSETDPLLAIEYHRGFTHALLLAPVGGALAASPLLHRAGETANRIRVLLASTAACASHGLLDAATTYGTQLFWPFTKARVGLDLTSVIDPLLTLALLVSIAALLMERRRAAAIALVVAAVWLSLGALQKERALDAQSRLAAMRGDRHERGAVFPTVGNRVVWRSIYATEGMLRIDRIRVPWLGEAEWAESDVVPEAKLSGLSPDLAADPRSRRDFGRFSWFSDGWIAAPHDDRSLIGDARYSLRADRYDPVWGIRFERGRVEWVDRTRERRVEPVDMWREITGRNLRFRPLQ